MSELTQREIRSIDISNIMYELEEVWQEHPDLRLGQLLEIGFGCNEDRCIFHESDIRFEHVLKTFPK